MNEKFEYNLDILDTPWKGMNRVTDDWFQNQFEALKNLDLGESVDKEGILAYFYEQSDTDLRNAITSLSSGLLSLMTMVLFDENDPYQKILWHRAISEFHDFRMICREYKEEFLKKIDSRLENIQKENIESLQDIQKHDFPVLNLKAKDFLVMDIEDILKT